MKVEQSNEFRRAYKKLKPNIRNDANEGIREIIADPLIGVKKKGDLGYLRVHKIKAQDQTFLIGYILGAETIILHTIGPHENFYRDLKK